MAYQKQTFRDGETVLTANMLNHIEDGIVALETSGGVTSDQIAPEYTQQVYDVGDMRIHDGVLYRCTTAIPVGEAWTASHWEEVSVGGEMTAANGNVAYIRDCAEEGVIPYAPGVIKTITYSKTSLSLTGTQNGNRVTFNGTGPYVGTTYYTTWGLTNAFSVGNSAPSGHADSYTIQTLVGHTYRISIRLVSGIIDFSNATAGVALRAEILNGQYTPSNRIAYAYLENGTTSGYADFAGTGELVRMHIAVPRLIDFTNAVLEIQLRDITDGSKTKLSTVTTVLGPDIPAGVVLPYDQPISLISAMKNAIKAWMGTYAGDMRKIPFIVHTDHHKRLNTQNKGFYKALADLVPWTEVSAVINLGDMEDTSGSWPDDDTNTDPLLRNDVLEKALDCLSPLPKDKQINVWGNHDIWYSGSLPTTPSGTLPDPARLNYYFPMRSNGSLRIVAGPVNSGMFEVFDDYYKVRYLVVAAWDFNARSSPSKAYYYLTVDHAEWIRDKLAENTGYSLVVVSHVPITIGYDDDGSIDPITGAAYVTTSHGVSLLDGTHRMEGMFRDRKACTSGTETIASQTIAYDFTACTDPFLCAIAGHTHADAVKHLGNLLIQTYDWFDNMTIHFGLFDQANGQVNVWKLSYDSNTAAVTNYQVPFIPT